jgi:hypothetical protein
LRDAADRALGRRFDQRFTSGDVKGMPCGIGEVIAEYCRPRAVVNSAVSMIRIGRHKIGCRAFKLTAIT